MKNLFLFSLLSVATMFATAQSTSPRFGVGAKEDNTGRVLTYSYQARVYAATDTVRPNASESVFKIGTLTGDQTMKTSVIRAHVCDKIVFLFLADGSARTVTFSTGFTPSATLVVDASQRASATFIFDGVTWLEQNRAKE